MTEPAQVRTEGEFEQFLKLLGRLNYTWTNTESLLIHLIAGLAPVEKEVAVVIFLTLNTTRARVDLVERLAKLGRVARDLREQVIDLTGRLQHLSKLRNRYNHCIYSFDPDGGSARSILMRISDRKSEIRMGQAGVLDSQAIRDVEAAIDDLGKLNKSMWAFIVAKGFPT